MEVVKWDDKFVRGMWLVMPLFSFFKLLKVDEMVVGTNMQASGMARLGHSFQKFGHSLHNPKSK